MFWAVARTQTRREATAAHFLGLGGYQVYVPRLRERRVQAGRRVQVLVPLFPSYVFVLVRNGFYSARATIGVVDLLMDGATPGVVRDEVIEALRAREVRGALELPRQRLKPGAKVRVLTGPLQGEIGAVAAMRPHERVLVLLSWLGRVEVSRDAVEVV
jgi:transcriptional antiterminator RfaH